MPREDLADSSAPEWALSGTQPTECSVVPSVGPWPPALEQLGKPVHLSVTSLKGTSSDFPAVQ